MRRASLTAAILASALLVPAGSAIANGGGGTGSIVAAVSADTCSKERKAVGGEAFTAKYGSPAGVACKRFVRKLARPAARTCKQERHRMGRDPFGRKYRSSRNQPRALARCINAKLRRSLSAVCPEDLVDDEDLSDDEESLEDEGDDLDDLDEERLVRAFASCSDDEDDGWEDIPGEEEEEEEDPADEDFDF
jgi:hypothetical protein